jgi:hypothetical protein
MIDWPYLGMESNPAHPSLVGGYVLTEEDDRCAEEGCHHPRYAHNGQSGRCVEGRMKHSAEWRCECRGFVEEDSPL